MQDFINSDILKFIYAFGIGQAILLSVLLFRKKENILSNRFLAIVFLLCSIELISGVYYLGDYYKNYPIFIGLTNGFAYLFGPLLYFYIYFIEPDNKLNPQKFLIHFIPFIIAYLFYLIPILGASTDDKFQFIQVQFAFNTQTKILGTFAPFHASIYIFFLLVEVKKIIKSIKYNYSTLEFINLYWLKYFFYGLLMQAIIIILLHIFETSFDFDIKYIMLFSIAIFMILAGYISLRQPDVKSFLVEPIASTNSKKEYKNPTIKKDQVDLLITKLKSVLENDKLYLNPKLSLKDLSDKTDISTHNLTEIINTQLNKSFYELINSYRVNEVKRLISIDKQKTYSLLALAYEAGFSSKTSFNTIFKKTVNMTPSEYRSKILS